MESLRSVISDQSARIQKLTALLAEAESQRELAIDLLRVLIKDAERVSEYGGFLGFINKAKELIE